MQSQAATGDSSHANGGAHLYGIPDHGGDVIAAETLDLANARGGGDVDLGQIAADHVDAHKYEATVLELGRQCGADCLLAVDTSPVDAAFADEATKVQLEGDRIVRIGKSLERWNASPSVSCATFVAP